MQVFRNREANWDKAALNRLACEEKDRQDSEINERRSENSRSTLESEDTATKKRSGLSILLGDDYTSSNETEDSSTESDPVLLEVDAYLKERPLKEISTFMVER